MTDPISDMLTRIRNASRVLLPEVDLPHSRMKESIAHILKKEGYVAEVAVEGKPPRRSSSSSNTTGKQERHRRLAPREHAGPAPLCRRDGNSARARRPGHFHPFHLARAS